MITGRDNVVSTANDIVRARFIKAQTPTTEEIIDKCAQAITIDTLNKTITFTCRHVEQAAAIASIEDQINLVSELSDYSLVYLPDPWQSTSLTPPMQPR